MSTLLWTPQHTKNTKMEQFMVFAGQKHNQTFNDYQQLHTWSIIYPALFWQTLCDFFELTFDTPPYQILNDYEEMYEARWFSGARFNFAEKLLNRRDNHPALICINEDNKKRIITYQQLYFEVAECAAGLKALGIGPGDRVVALMPNAPYTVIAMLAAASLGAIWSCCSPEFGAQAVIDRLEQLAPKVLFICDGYQYQGKKYSSKEKIEQVTSVIPSLIQTIICPSINESIDCSALSNASYWDHFIKPATHCDFASLPFAHPLYVLFSSGTTGKPKCIIHSAGGTLVQHIKELGLHCDLQSHDNLFFYMTCGWMMWNWTVSALALGVTLTLYEGSPTYPDTTRLFQLIDEEKVTVFGTSPKFLSSIEKTGIKPKDHFNLNHLRCILATGSPLLSKNYNFVYQEIKDSVQLSSISGGTDIISCFALGNPLLPIYQEEIQCFGLGMDIAIFNDKGESVYNQRGELVCIKPFPSMPIGFWNDPEHIQYKNTYFNRFAGVWAHGDYAEITKHQGLIIYGRSDAVLNPGGVRIGTAEIYRHVEKIDEVMDSLVISQDWQEDVRIILFVKLKEELILDEALINSIKNTIRKNASPRHVPAKILQVMDIPRTINDKLVELAVKKIINGQQIDNLQFFANPHALEYFKNRPELQS